MSETAVLEAPKAQAPKAAAPSPASPPKLVCSREEAARHIQSQLQKGAEIKALRIRNGQELDAARAAKLEWTARTAEVLNGLFDTPLVAEQCNDWVGRIYPEYAEFGNFVEQFYAEMDHRLGRLRAVDKFAEKAPISGQTPSAAAAPAPSTAPKAAPAQVAGVVAQAPRLQTLTGLLVAQKTDPAIRAAVVDLLKSLQIELNVVEQTGDLTSVLDRNRDISFAVVLSGESQEDQFALGFCAGRVGINRVILLNSQADVVLSDGSSCLTQMGMDSGGGWQLQLAKHLKRAGISVDLNRLC